MMGRFHGKVAIVAGSSRGIGLATGRLATEGARVVLSARHEEELTASVDKLRADGLDVTGVAASLSAVDTPTRLVDAAVDSYGRIDLLVNNAGTGTRERLFDVTEEAWDRVHAVNLRAPFFYMQAVGRHMVERGAGGHIISVSSASGFRAVFTHPVYSSSKAGIDALTRSMASALGEHGINVNAVAPGLTATRMGAGIGDEAAQQQAVESGPLANLLQRVSQPEDVAEVIAFLCLPESRQITGQTIHTSAGNVV
jgi:NAD(P)-dependent dehydrogenase (short-subunit alcohol dehydrogenase family)